MALTKEQKLAKIQALEEKKRRLLKARPAYVPNEGQLKVHTDPSPIRVVTSGNGCWAKGTKFRMYDGTTVPVEDLRPGDKLMGPDGAPRTIQETHTGTEEMYEVQPKHTENYIVNKSHVLSLYSWKKPGQGKPQKKLYEEITVAEYLERSDAWKRVAYQWKAPGIEYPKKEVQIDPYILGLWLGDGTSRETHLTTMDKEIREAWLGAYPDYNVRVLSKRTGKAKTYCLSNNGKNELLNHLRGYEVLNNKHVPQVYKINDKKTRLELLAGLIDTDGYASQAKYYEIVQKRKQLAEDIKEIANSLGFKTTMHAKNIKGTDYWRVNIIGDVWDIPVRLPHKKIKAYKYQREARHEPFKIEPKGKGAYYGFSVDKDRLILKHDYVVQHNSGKSTLGVQEAFWIAKGYNPITKEQTKVPAVVVVVLDLPQKADDVFVAEARKWFDFEEVQLNKRGRPYTTEIQFKNGSKIQFMSHSQEPMAFESIQLTAAIFDEPCPKYCFTGLLRGARQRGVKPKMLFIGTPLGQPWMYNDLILPAQKGERPDIGLHRYSTRVNERNLADGYLENFERNLSDKEKQARIEGHPVHLESLALAHLFHEDTHTMDPFPWPAGKPVVIAIDPAFSKAHTAVMVGSVGDGRLYYIKELQSKSPPKEFARELRDWYRDYNVMDILCDSMSNIPTTGGEGNKSFAEVLREQGVRMRTTDFKEKSDTDFIQRIMQVLEIPLEEDKFGRKVPVLAIFNTCKGIINDIEACTWQKQRGHEGFKNKLEISNRDYLACLKYSLTTNISLMTERLTRPKIKRSGRSPWSGTYHRK